MPYRFFSGLGILLFILSTAMASPPSTSPRPNVILITLSSLRADHTSLLGYQRLTTGHLDAFARRSVTFTNAFATSGWMMPAHASILTGLYPKDHQVTHISKKLTDSFVTITEILKAQDYICVGFCCNPRLNSDAGFAQGFDLYDDYSVMLHLENFALDSQAPLDLNTSRTNDLINDAAIGWLKRNTQQPFFLFIHYYDTHWDYLPPAPYDTLFDPNYTGAITGHQIAREPLFSNPPADNDIEHLIALYDGEIRQSDQDLGELLEVLEQTNLLANSLVIITADHGEQFYEHGYTSHHGLYEELIHVPLVISIPQPQTQSLTTDALVSQVDIIPTILDFLDLPPLQSGSGVSLKPLLTGNTEKVHDVIFAEYSGGAAPDMAMIRSDRYKLYNTAGESAMAFDILRDLGEQDKIKAKDFTAALLTLKNQLQTWLTP